MIAVPGTVYSCSAPLLDGRLVSLDELRGRVLLIVNTASQCGFTPQYKGLEQLYLRFKDRGFSVLGFPCNQFGSQEPGSAGQIATFCEQHYGITFPVFAKIEVNGPGTHPLYQFLKKSRPGIFGTLRIKWNFTKFLIDRQGSAVSRLSPKKGPPTLVAQIERLLAAPPADPEGC